MLARIPANSTKSCLFGVAFGVTLFFEPDKVSICRAFREFTKSCIDRVRVLPSLEPQIIESADLPISIFNCVWGVTTYLDSTFVQSNVQTRGERAVVVR